IKSLSLRYQSTVSFHFTEDKPHTDIEFFHLAPFGYQTIYQNGSQGLSLHLFPHYTHQGNLFIGLQDIQPPAHIDLLFQVKPDSFEASGNVPKIEWHYLSGDEWIPFRSNSVTIDPELAFIMDSVIGFDLPSDMSLTHNIMPSGFLWIKATTVNLEVEKEAEQIEAFSQLKGIYPNGARVTRVLDPNVDTVNLPSQSIQKTVVDFPGILKIHQPSPTLGGRAAEEEPHFMMRAAERLRHKNRAISPWDIERLVLENFPHIQEVKCIRNQTTDSIQKEINHTYEWGEGGAIQVVVMSQPVESQQSQVFKPRLSSFELYEIQHFLTRHASPMAQIEVINPLYEELQIVVGIGIAPGANGAMVAQKLNTALRKYLSPWAFGEREHPAFVTELPINAIIGFIQDQPLVEEIHEIVVLQFSEATGEKMAHAVVHEGLKLKESVIIKPSNAASVLVSSPKHSIHTRFVNIEPPDPSPKKEEKNPDETYSFQYFGIGYMEIGHSMIVDPEYPEPDADDRLLSRSAPLAKRNRKFIFFK
ncbi:MAG: hypothetical protein AAFR59_01795, partial [Bacteroidota bacterium]